MANQRRMYSLLCFLLHLSHCHFEAFRPTFSLSIVGEPQDVSRETISDPITISCFAEGDNPIVVSWFKDGRELNLNGSRVSSSTGILVIQNPLPEDAGEYRCLVSNRHGRLWSRRARVRVPYLGEFQHPSSRVTVEEGRPSVLNCYAPSGLPRPYISWYRVSGGDTLAGDPTSVLVQNSRRNHRSVNLRGDLYLCYSEITDRGEYSCQVEHPLLRTSRRRSVTLEVYENEALSNQEPRVAYFNATRIREDGHLILECVASGRPIPTTRLLRRPSGVELARADGAHVSATLLPDTQPSSSPTALPESNPVFDCEATNVYGQSVRASIMIPIEEPPSWIRPLSDRIIDVDSIFAWPCEARGSGPLHVTWYKDGSVLRETAELSVRPNTLVFLHASIGMSGAYQCEVSNKFGTIISSAFIRIQEFAPTFGPGSVPPPDNLHVLVGDDAAVPCSSLGSPRPTIMWSRIDTSTPTLIINSSRVFVTSDGTLHILAVTRLDEGFFSCTASNRLGRETRRTKISIRARLAISSASEDISVTEGRSFDLTCAVKSSNGMEISFQWFRNGVPVQESPRSRTFLVSELLSRLRVLNARLLDGGVYVCKASTTRKSGSSDSKDFYVTVMGVPDAPQRPQVKSLDSFTVQITWRLRRENNSPISRLHVVARTESLASGATTSYSVSVENPKPSGSTDVSLRPYSRIKFSLAAENEVGSSQRSPETEEWIESPASAPPECPTDIQLSLASENSVTVSWKEIPQELWAGKEFQYIVLYRQLGASAWTSSSVSSGKKNITLRNLQQSSIYEFSMSCLNEIGRGPTSKQVPITTIRKKTIQRSITLSVSIQSAEEVLLTWTDDFNGYQASFSYKVAWCYSEDCLEQNTAHVLWTYFKWARLVVLRGERLWTQVTRALPDGSVSTSPVLGPILVPERDVIRVESMRVEVLEENGGLRVSWLPPKIRSEEVTGYRLEVDTIPPGGITRLTVHRNRTSWVFVDMPQTVRYLFQVTALTNDSLESTGVNQTFDFANLPQAVAKDFDLTAGSRSVFLSWKIEDHPDVQRYKISLRQNEEKDGHGLSSIEATHKGGNFTVAGLLPDRNYTLRVAAQGPLGYGPYAEIYFRTLPEVDRMSSNRSSESSSSSTLYSLFDNFSLVIALGLVAVLI